MSIEVLANVKKEEASTTAAALGLPEFNHNPHIFLKVDGGATVSVNFAGKLLTFAFVDYAESGSPARPGCCDVKLHNSSKVRTPNAKHGDNREMVEQRGIMFDGGCSRVNVTGTLYTVLLSE